MSWIKSCKQFSKCDKPHSCISGASEMKSRRIYCNNVITQTCVNKSVNDAQLRFEFRKLTMGCFDFDTVKRHRQIDTDNISFYFPVLLFLLICLCVDTLLFTIGLPIEVSHFLCFFQYSTFKSDFLSACEFSQCLRS